MILLWLDRFFWSLCFLFFLKWDCLVRSGPQRQSWNPNPALHCPRWPFSFAVSDDWFLPLWPFGFASSRGLPFLPFPITSSIHFIASSNSNQLAASATTCNQASKQALSPIPSSSKATSISLCLPASGLQLQVFLCFFDLINPRAARMLPSNSFFFLHIMH